MAAGTFAATVQPAVLTALVELAIVAVLCGALVLVLTALSRRLAATSQLAMATIAPLAVAKSRRLIVGLSGLVAAVILIYNGWLAAHGIDARAQTMAGLRAILEDGGRALGRMVSQLALLAIVLVVAVQLVRIVLRSVEHLIDRVDQHDDRQMLAKAFAGLDRAVLNLGWLLGAVVACRQLQVPAGITDPLAVFVRIYIVVVIGIAAIRSAGAVVGLLDRLAERYVRQRDWERYYDQLHTLLPTFRTCLEYALWIAVIALALNQVSWLQRVSAWGPLLIEGVAIFFVGQVLIQLGYLEIGHRMLPRDGLEESERRRRATMVPLVRSTFMYVAYFITAVLILGALGFNPMPFLAGAGILGLVIGFGAQSMINDVVSGFFILFENIYLVGDIIECGSARGMVEAIEFRTTKIRDADGRLHIVRNGDMKLVVNYSKDYGVAAVALEVGYDADLRAVFSCLRQVGRQVKSELDAVVGDAEVQGITAFGPSSMTIRVSTRVKPGYHDTVAAAMRLLIKESFDTDLAGVVRKSLIPERWSPAVATSGYGPRGHDPHQEHQDH
jgi:small conductance mechanosensitive channel